MNEIGYQIGVWFDQNRRDLPWRHTKDAYRIWLSEIILQQTRVAQGLDYYERFVAAYPRVDDLAAAPLDQVLKLSSLLRTAWTAYRSSATSSKTFGRSSSSRFRRR